jgi:hypothetical protein
VFARNGQYFARGVTENAQSGTAMNRPPLILPSYGFVDQRTTHPALAGSTLAELSNAGGPHLRSASSPTRTPFQTGKPDWVSELTKNTHDPSIKSLLYKPKKSGLQVVANFAGWTVT